MAPGNLAPTDAPARFAVLRRIQTFDALRYPDYRLLWFGMFGNSMSLWMETVARSWLVWELTGSGLALGLVNFFRAIPFLTFGLVSGVAADRVDKRRLLLVTQTVTMSIHFLMAALIFSHVIELWQVYVTALLAGISMSFEQPNRQSLIPQLVERDNLVNAVALNTMVMNVSRILGPTLAGLLIGFVGISGVYLFQGITYVGVIIMTFMLSVPPRPARDGQKSAIADLKEGFAYVGKNSAVLGLLIVALVPMIFGMPYTTVLPVFADKVLHTGASGLGLLLSGSGLGALAGSIAIATLGNLRRRGLLVLAFLFLFGVFLIAFSFATSLQIALLLLAGVGITFTSYMAINNATLLQMSPSGLHGRIMAIYLLDRGLTPLGAVMAGALTDAVGSPFVLAFMGTLCVLLALAMGFVLPQVRDID